MNAVINWVRGFGMPEWVLTGLLALIVITVLAVIEEHKAFMTECLVDHKRYECAAMWRSAHMQVQPVIITR